MSNPTSNQPISGSILTSDLAAFVSTAFDTYKNKLAVFAFAESSLTTDDAKISQASIHIADIASAITSDYLKSNSGLINDGTLGYGVAMHLLRDGRVAKLFALPGSDWDALENLAQFADPPSYNLFVSTIKARDELRARLTSFCC